MSSAFVGFFNEGLTREGEPLFLDALPGNGSSNGLLFDRVVDVEATKAYRGDCVSVIIHKVLFTVDR